MSPIDFRVGLYIMIKMHLAVGCLQVRKNRVGDGGFSSPSTALQPSGTVRVSLQERFELMLTIYLVL